MSRLSLAAFLAALLAIAPAASYAGPGEGAGPGRGGPRGGPRAGAAFGRMHARMHRQHRKTARLLRMLELTDAQRAIVAEGSALAAPVRRDLHQRIRAIFEDARTSPRTKETRQALHAQVKAAVQSALAALDAPARKVLDSLTADQKAKLEAKAKEHGRTFDEQKLLKAFEVMLLAPRHGGQRHAGGMGRGEGGFGPRDGRAPRDGRGPGDGRGPRGGGRGFRGGDGR